MILILGDNHGRFDHIPPAIAAERARSCRVDAVIFLGDIEAQRDFEQEVAPIEALGVAVHWIVGNHDTDSEDNWRHLQNSQHRRIDGRVVEVCGIRVAGLGGIFRGAIWFPADSKSVSAEELHFRNYEGFARDLHSRPGVQRRLSKMDRIRLESVPDRVSAMIDPTRSGQLRKHASSIFPDTLQSLATQRADILVTHEAPGCHPHGFDELTRLAQSLGVRASFHGHQHDNLDYSSTFDSLGFRPHGVGLRGITAFEPETGEVRVVAPGELDESRRSRRVRNGA